jgi:hypothetical protein
MQDTSGKLTPKQERAIASLLSQPTIEAAAESLGVNPATIHRWLSDPAFADAYRDARRAAVTQAVTRLQQVSGAAVGVLVQVMADKANPASTRVNAAKTVLEFSFRAVELEDLAERIAALEQTTGAKS